MNSSPIDDRTYDREKVSVALEIILHRLEALITGILTGVEGNPFIPKNKASYWVSAGPLKVSQINTDKIILDFWYFLF